MTDQNGHPIAPRRYEAQLAELLRKAEARNGAWRQPVHHHGMNWKVRSAMWLIVILAGGAASLAPRLWS